MRKSPFNLFHLIHRFRYKRKGTSASNLHFQAYLLEGVIKKQPEGNIKDHVDRSDAAVANVVIGPETYSGALAKAANELSARVMGKKMRPGLQEVGAYTGELTG